MKLSDDEINIPALAAYLCCTHKPNPDSHQLSATHLPRYHIDHIWTPAASGAHALHRQSIPGMDSAEA